MALEATRAEINTYVQNKKWYWYIPAWLLGLYLFVGLLKFELGGNLPFLIAIPQAFDFFLHEMAHLFTAFLPPIMVAAAGSASELLLGVILIVTAFMTRSYFASLFCFLWFMLATQSVADYIADASTQALPLISFGGGDPIHDWNFILTRLGLLEYDAILAQSLRIFGVLVGIFALFFTLWLMCRIAMGSSAPSPYNFSAKKPQVTNITPKIGMEHMPPPSEKSSSLYPEALLGPLGVHEDPKPKK